MKVFISHSKRSGNKSSLLAEELKILIENSFERRVECWFSPQDIQSGSVWHSSLLSALKECDYGIACLTGASFSSNWIHFEAGAIACSLPSSSTFVPLIFELPEDTISAQLIREYEGPLTHFQKSDGLNKESVFAILLNINRLLPENVKMSEGKLEHRLESRWPSYAKEVHNILKAPNQATDSRFTRNEKIDQILDIITKSKSQERTVKGDFYFLDISEIIGQSLSDREGYKIMLPFPTVPTIEKLCNQVFSTLCEYVDLPAFSYGKVWEFEVLAQSFNRDLLDQSPYLLSKGEVRDQRPIELLGISNWGRSIVKARVLDPEYLASISNYKSERPGSN